MTFTSFTDVLDGRKNLCTLLTLEGLFCLLIKLDYNKVTYWHCNWLIGHLENFPTILLKVDGFIVSWLPGNLGWTSKADMVLMLVLLWSPLPLLPVGEELEVSLASLTKSFFARMHGRNIFFFKLGKEQFVSYITLSYHHPKLSNLWWPPKFSQLLPKFMQVLEKAHQDKTK